MKNTFLNTINSYFGFLYTEHGFKGPYEYSWNHEWHVNYIKGHLVFDIVFDHPFYFLKLYDIKEPIDKLENGEISFKDLWSQNWTMYELYKLTGDKGSTLKKLRDVPIKQLEYYNEILRSHPELIDGDFKQFASWRILMRKLFKGHVAA